MYNGDKRVNPHVTRIIETRNKEIWITTSGQGAFSIKKHKDEVRAEVRLRDILTSNYLYLIFEDSHGNLWIGSENDGLNLYSPQASSTPSEFPVFEVEVLP